MSQLHNLQVLVQRRKQIEENSKVCKMIKRGAGTKKNATNKEESSTSYFRRTHATVHIRDGKKEGDRKIWQPFQSKGEKAVHILKLTNYLFKTYQENDTYSISKQVSANEQAEKAVGGSCGCEL